MPCQWHRTYVGEQILLFYLMSVWALTGGIGMGKSTVASIFSRKGVWVTDTDQIARDLVRPGLPALEALVQQFGNVILAPDGGLARNKLAAIVFSDSSARRRLESILHPMIRQEWQRQVQCQLLAGATLAVVVIPLLYETEAESLFDQVVCVGCTPRAQMERLIQRGWSTEEIHRRMAAQLPAEEKMRRSHRVLWSEGSLGILEEQVARILREARWSGLAQQARL